MRKQLGKKSEEIACQFLQTKGMRLLQQNFSCHFGEIDLVMQEGQDLVFVEVRSRSRTDYGFAQETIDRRKINKLFKTANYFLQRQNLLYKINSRFDVVAIHYVNQETQIEWFKNAFGEE